MCSVAVGAAAYNDILLPACVCELLRCGVLYDLLELPCRHLSPETSVHLELALPHDSQPKRQDILSLAEVPDLRLVGDGRARGHS